MVRVSKDLPKSLIMQAGTPHEVRTTLKTKYLVSKNHQDFTNLDKEQNDFEVKEENTDPENMFATSYQHSNNLKEFGSRHDKD